MTDYTNKAQQRIVKLIEVLALNDKDGLSLGELAKKMDATVSMTFRDLSNLEVVGWARQVNGQWFTGCEGPARVISLICEQIQKERILLDQIEKRYLGENHVK